MPYNHLTLEERYEIKHLTAQKYSIREIGRMLGRSHSTISRELRRNASRNSSYCASKANEKYRNRRVACRREPLYMHRELMRYLVGKLTQCWSPQQIAGRLPLDFPETPYMRVSHESIYRWLYDLASLRPFRGYLRRRHKKRRKRNGRKVQRVSIPNRVGIEQRPKLVEAQERFGDWEADLVLGAHQDGAIVTLVERKSMLLRVGLVASKHAEGVAQATIDALLDMPKSWVRTMTFDNGKEFAAHEKIAQTLGIETYFAQPYASYQRGKNENTNGLLRQYLPKKTSFKNLSFERLLSYVEDINNRPRKNLGYRTPMEIFYLYLGALKI